VAGSARAGTFVQQPSGYVSFKPAPLPPEPPVAIDEELLGLLSEADQALGRLDGMVRLIPDPDLFVGMYVRREAVLSSQIEGTQSTLEDLLEQELDPDSKDPLSDVGEIVNYVRAMSYGLQRLHDLPLSLRLIREIHAELLRHGRGAHATPGEFRRTQNWIGPPGATLRQATFVPPTVPDMVDALHDFERFLQDVGGRHVLLDIGLVHAQFETIHPFLDGNGRVGRLLITFLLVHKGVLREPLLYLSHYLKLHRLEYYDRLMEVRRRGDWEGWLRFFLRGVAQTAGEATATAERIYELRERHRALVMDEAGAKGLRLLSELYRRPLININYVRDYLGVAFPTASRLVMKLVDLGVLRETTGQRRSRRFRYEPYLLLFEDQSEPAEQKPPELTATDGPSPDGIAS
jgi:Fic family protein